MTMKVLPGQADQPAEIICPNCGHFVGALTRCTHCGARVEKRVSVRVFRWAAMGLGTIGLGLLYLMAIHRDIPEVQVGAIKPTMNFAYIKVTGTVAGDPRVFKEAGKVRSLRFIVDDGTGEISVTAFRSQAQALVDRGLLPRFGDRVEVSGSLSMSADDDVVMRLQVPEHLVLTRAEVPVTPLGDVTAALAGNNLSIEGAITKVNAPPPESKAPWVVGVRDDTGENEITFWQSLYGEIKDKALLVPGARLRARVSVRTYRDKVQLMLNAAEDLEFLSGSSESAPAVPADAGAADRPAPPPKTARPASPRTPTRSGEAVQLSALSAEMEGRMVTFYGRVAEVKVPAPDTREPYRVTLEEDGSKILVVYWDTVARRLGSNQPILGALMKVRGLVGQYENELQVKVTYSDQLALVDVQPPATAPTPSEGEQAIGRITAAMAGRVFTVTGTLGEPRSIRGGVIFTLSDDTGEIQLVLWDRAVPGGARDALEAGRRVKVTGKIGTFREALQIEPANAQALNIL